jgi:hypothetical protein
MTLRYAAVLIPLVAACSAGPALLVDTSPSPAADIQDCVVQVVETRGYEVRTNDREAGLVRALRERFDAEPVFDALEVRIIEAGAHRRLEVRVEEVRLARVGGPTTEARRDAEILLAACSG